MDISNVVSVSIEAANVYPSRGGFGTPLALCLHNFWPDRVRLFDCATVVSELGTLNVPAHHPMSRMAALVSALPQKPKRIAIGKRLSAYTIVHTLTPTVTTEGFVYRFTVCDTAGLETEIVYTVPAAATLTSVGTGIAALIDPLVGLTAVSAAGVITVTGTLGAFHYLSDLPRPDILQVVETTANPGLAADLTSLAAAIEGTSISFFGVTADVLGEPAAKDLSAWAAARGICCVIRSTDFGISDAGSTTDLASDLKLLARRNTIGVFDQRHTASFLDLSVLAEHMARPVGSATAALKSHPGIAPSLLTSGQSAAVRAKNWSTYESIDGKNGAGGVALLFESKSSAGSFMDSFFGQKKLESDIQVATLGYAASLPKVPITRAGIKGAAAAVLSELNLAVEAGYLAGPDAESGETGPTVTAPDLADIPLDQRAARRINGITFSAREAGAAHGFEIRGTVGV